MSSKTISYSIVIYLVSTLYYIQGYPQRIRLQRRLILVGQNWLISVLEVEHFVNHQNIQLNAETKNQALNRHIEFWVVFTGLFFEGEPVYYR